MDHPRSGLMTHPHNFHPVGVLGGCHAGFQGLTPLAIDFRPFGTNTQNTREVAITDSQSHFTRKGASSPPLLVNHVSERASPLCSAYTPRVGIRNDSQALHLSRNAAINQFREVP